MDSLLHLSVHGEPSGGRSYLLHPERPRRVIGRHQMGAGRLGYQNIDNSVAIAFNVSSQSNPKAGSGVLLERLIFCS